MFTSIIITIDDNHGNQLRPFKPLDSYLQETEIFSNSSLILSLSLRKSSMELIWFKMYQKFSIIYTLKTQKVGTITLSVFRPTRTLG